MQKTRLQNIVAAITLKRVILVGVVLLVFMGGVFVGQGKIGFLNEGAYTSRNTLPTNFNYKQVDELYQTLRQNYDGKLTEDQVIEGLKHGLAKSTGDPYTEYFNASEATEFNSELQGTISGIGAQLELDQAGTVTVVAPLGGSPAEAAGLRAKDAIISVDGKSTANMTVSDAVEKIRGKKGTTVKLVVLRDGKQRLDFTIKRDTIQIPTAVSKILDDNVGYLQVSQFSEDTNRLVSEAVTKFQESGVKKVILDLRDNPGGEVSTAVSLSSLWLDKGDLIVQQRRGDVVIDNQYATKLNSLKGMKTVVLVNGGSASASEITALALRDHKAAYMIGEKTYGKGVVQQLIPFSDGSSLKVTVARWYSPNGTNINLKGISPDKTVAPTEDDYKNNNDVQLKAAQDWLSQQ